MKHTQASPQQAAKAASRNPHRNRLVVLLATAGLIAAIGMAEASETDRLMDTLIDKGVITTDEAARIREEAQQEKNDKRVDQPGRALGYEPTAPLRDEDVQVQVRNFAVESRDGRERFRIRGRVQLDAAWADFGSDIQNVARQGHDFPQYGVILRRVRLGALGLMHENWEWQLEVDFSENEVDLANVYIAYLMSTGRLAFGHFKEPFGMEYATSSRYITFIERSAASDAYKVSREPGIMYETIRRNWYGAIGVFGGGINFDREVREGWSVAGRASYAPYLSGTDFIHVGAGVNHRRNAFDRANDRHVDVRLRTREGTRAIDARLIGRDDLVAVEDFTRYGLEFAAGFGSWSMVSEYIRVDIDLDRDELIAELGGNATDDSSLTQDGWYVQTSYFLTGEQRPYRAFSGDFGRVAPRSNFALGRDGWGAFEIALRYSEADSLEHTRVGRGQKLQHWTAGLNWYLNQEVMLKANIIYLEGERDVFEDDGWVYGVRFQYLF